MEYKITQETLQAVLDYLTAKPYKEVFLLMDKVRLIEAIEQAPQEDFKTNKKAKK